MFPVRRFIPRLGPGGRVRVPDGGRCGGRRVTIGGTHLDDVITGTGAPDVIEARVATT